MRVILAVIFEFYSVFLFSQKDTKLKFGLNPNIFDTNFIQIVEDPIQIKTFFEDYNIEYIRFPGGSNAGIFFWDNPDLLNNTLLLFSKYKDFTGSRISKQQKHLPKANIYNRFLHFCKSNKINPIIQLNTTYYHIGDTVFQVDRFKRGYLNTPLPETRYDIILH